MKSPSKHHSYKVNGKTYSRLKDVPKEYQSYFEDKDGNGIPDHMDKLLKQSDVTRTYKFNDKEYKSLKDMPPDIRTHFEKMETDGLMSRLKSESQNVNQNFGQKNETTSPSMLRNYLVAILGGVAITLGILWILKFMNTGT